LTAGGSTSLTVIVKAQWFVLFEVSLAVQFTMVTPFENNEPGDGVQVTVTP
jgi:hypothetical protein